MPDTSRNDHKSNTAHVLRQIAKDFHGGAAVGDICHASEGRGWKRGGEHSQVLVPPCDEAEGVLFSHAYCQGAVCTPSRTSLMLGSTMHGQTARSSFSSWTGAGQAGGSGHTGTQSLTLPYKPPA